jgi:hypothetical protein
MIVQQGQFVSSTVESIARHGRLEKGQDLMRQVPARRVNQGNISHCHHSFFLIYGFKFEHIH